MPPRFSYWTIIAGGLPTAFRATEREELLPTFTRLKDKHPDAEMKWFARGKLWASPEAASEDNRNRARGTDRGTDSGGKGRHRDRAQGGERREARGKDWRPGGEHRDPRQKYKDQKKERNQHIKQEKFLRKFTAEHDRRHAPEGDREPRERRETPRPRQEQRAWSKPREDRRDGSVPREAKREWPKPREEKRAWSKPREEKRSWSKPREEKRPWSKPRGEKPESSKPRTGDRAAAPRARREDGWTPPHGDKLTAPPRRDGDRRGKPFAAKPAGGGWRGDRPKPGGGDRFHKDERRPWPSSRRDEERPHGDPLAPEHRSGARGSRQGSDRPWQPKPRGGEERPWQPKPRSGEGGGFRPREERDSRPAREGDRNFKGRGHGDNAWKPKSGSGTAGPPPRGEGRPSAPRPRSGDGGQRPFAPRGFDRERSRGSGTEEPRTPPRPRGPNREPRPGEEPPPSAPPRPSEPVIPPPGPPERGRLNKGKRGR